MPDEIISREAIARQADAAAQRSVAVGAIEANPHAPNTAASRIWAAAFNRYLLLHSSVEDAEGGA